MSDFNAKEEVKPAQILDSKIILKSMNKSIRGSGRRTNKDDIVNINQEIHGYCGPLKKKQGCVCR